MQHQSSSLKNVVVYRWELEDLISIFFNCWEHGFIKTKLRKSSLYSLVFSLEAGVDIRWTWTRQCTRFHNINSYYFTFTGLSSIEMVNWFLFKCLSLCFGNATCWVNKLKLHKWLQNEKEVLKNSLLWRSS